jgi:metal-responsive CopG/Arc/MetJ family transcriptional regulator
MTSAKQIRRSITLPSRLAQQVERIAKKKRLSDNRVLLDLVELGLEAQKEKEKRFFALAERLRSASDAKEIKQLGDEMGQFIFGE